MTPLLFNREWRIEVTTPKSDVASQNLVQSEDGRSQKVETGYVGALTYTLSSDIDFTFTVSNNSSKKAAVARSAKLVLKGMGNSDLGNSIKEGAHIVIYAGYTSQLSDGYPPRIYSGVVTDYLSSHSKSRGSELTLTITPNADIVKRSKFSATYKTGTALSTIAAELSENLNTDIVLPSSLLDYTITSDLCLYGRTLSVFKDYLAGIGYSISFVNDSYRVLPEAGVGGDTYRDYQLATTDVLSDIGFVAREGGAVSKKATSTKKLRLKTLLTPMDGNVKVILGDDFEEVFQGEYIAEEVTYSLDSAGTAWYTNLLLARLNG